MPQHRQEQQRNLHQKKMEQEYKRLEKECRSCVSKVSIFILNFLIYYSIVIIYYILYFTGM